MKRNNGNITDMTEGNPGKLLWRFSLPLLLSVFFQQLYNLTDSVVVGQFDGEMALAAVGASYPITMIYLAFATGINIGCSVVISQLFGAKNYRDMKSAISTSLISGLSIAVILTILGLSLSSPLMALLNTPSDILVQAREYVVIYTGGLIFLFAYNIVNGIFTALGDSKTPLYFLIASSLGNIGADILFVAVFHMGVAGVAWATFICQGIAAVCSTITLMKRIWHIGEKERYNAFSFPLLKQLTRIAIPSILQQSFVSVGVLLVQSVVNGFGSAVVAGYSAAVKLNTFAITGFNTLTNGLSSYTAQNIGAKKIDRVKKGYRSAIKMALVVAVAFTLIYLLAGRAMIGLFMNESNSSEEAFLTGIEFLRIVSPFYFMLAIKLMADGVLRGAGAVKYFTFSTFLDLFLRVVLAFIFPEFMGCRGVWWSWPPSWLIGAAVSTVFYVTGVWRKKKTFADDIAKMREKGEKG